MNTLDFLIKKYKLDLSTSSPIKIPNMGRNILPEWFHELDFKIGIEGSSGDIHSGKLYQILVLIGH